MIMARGQKLENKPLASLTCRTDRIVDDTDREVLLRGMNAGSWFMLEPWICGIGLPLKSHARALARECDAEDALKVALSRIGPFDDDTTRLADYLDRLGEAVARTGQGPGPGRFRERLKTEPPLLDALSLDRLFRKRFGEDGAAAFWETFHRCWITPEDLRAARSVGFNFIRLPFWYRWLESDDAPGAWLESGFRMLESAVAMAAEAGLYVLLDLHGAPGGQSMWDHTGEAGRNTFFDDAACQARAAALWRVVAERFRNEPAVAGYDLLNEPAGARDLETWTLAHDQMYRAIRAVDPSRPIIMEDGYKLEEPRHAVKGWFPMPDARDWQNVVYSVHFYKTGSFEAHEKQARLMTSLAEREGRRCRVPMYIGEFNTIEDTPDALRAMTYYGRIFSDAGINWSPWTLKYCGEDARQTLWGLIRSREPWEPVQPYRDDLDAILTKVRRYAEASRFQVHEDYAKALAEGCS